jgi:RimJ/RimL family protein N-acetyltransferase
MPGPAFIRGEAVDLHTIEEEDLPFLREWVNDPRVWRGIDRATPSNATQQRAFYEEVVCDEGSVTLLLCADGTPVGMVGLEGIDERAGSAEVGYWVVPDERGQGYATEAVALVVDHGFEELRLHRVAARVHEGNEASRRVLERVGFTREGVHREAAFRDGEYRDTWWYGLLEGDRG